MVDTWVYNEWQMIILFWTQSERDMIQMNHPGTCVHIRPNIENQFKLSQNRIKDLAKRY